MTALSDRFYADLARLGQRHRTDPANFLVVWCAESDLTPTAVNAAGGARGLNQMTPDTLRGLGAPADFDKLAAEDQLPWIERLISARERLNGGPFESAARYYHSNFFPLTMARGSSPGTVVVAGDADNPRERAAYAANTVLDADGDGQITLADLAAVLDRVRATRCPGAFARLDRAVGALPSPGVTWEDTPPIVARRGGVGAVVAGAALALGVVGLALRRTR
jgi:hypothetical protein